MTGTRRDDRRDECALASICSHCTPRNTVVIPCWLAVGALFVVIGARISMVDKQVFYIIPALALGVGLLAGRLWRRGLPARLVVAGFYLFAFVAALQMWIYRIATVR